MTPKTIQSHLAMLREFWTMNRAAHVVGKLPGESNYMHGKAMRESLGNQMILWAQGIQIPSESPKTLEEAVIVAFAIVILTCRDQGDQPGWECFCTPPKVTQEFLPHTEAWRIGWESGPHNGAPNEEVIPDHIRQGPGYYSEPYYSFDLVWEAE